MERDVLTPKTRTLHW